MAKSPTKTMTPAKTPAAKPAAPAAGKDAKDVKAKAASAKPGKDEKVKKLGAPVAVAPGKPANPAAGAKPAKGAKPGKGRDDADADGDGDGDEEEDDDFAPPAKAKRPGKPGKGRPGKALAMPDLLDDDDVIPPAGDFADDEEDDLDDRRGRSSSADADAAALAEEGRASKKGRGNNNNAATSAKDKLIELGKQKGFVTYDEVNDAMPEDVVSTDQIDSWLSALGDHGIEVVDGAGPRREAIVDQPKGLDIEKEKEEGEVDEDEEYAYSRTSDPVRMYLRMMGSGSLLTREGEGEIAKRIEDGERKMLQAVLNSSVAVEELIAIGERLRQGKIRVKDVVKDIDEDEAEFNEQFYVDRVCKIIDKVKKLQRDTEKLEEKLDEDGTEGKKKKVKEATKANRAQMFEELSDLRLNKPTVDRIVAQLKNIIIKLDKAESEIRDCEKRCGMPASEIRKTLREMRANPARARAVGKKLGMTLADFEEMEELIKP